MDVVFPKPGKYVVAVSGGVDSVVLLDILQRQTGLELVVAHFDHGIRPDSGQDREFVGELATKYGLEFVYAEGKLGQVSEATARAARYKYLRQICKSKKTKSIITAHHQDDVLETVIINMLRGTGRRGLNSLSSGSISRPLLNVPKQKLIDYANNNKLEWHEDNTNQDVKYLRNYVRHKLLPKFSAADRKKLLGMIQKAKVGNQKLDTLLVKYIQYQSVNEGLERLSFNSLPHNVAREVLASWFRDNNLSNYDKKTLERLVVAAKIAQAGQVFPVLKGYKLRVNKHNLALQGPER